MGDVGKNSSGPGRLVRTVVLEQPIAWGVLAFGLFFWYSQFLRSIGWNAVELIIAQHLLQHGTYSTALDYPSAITWRPVFPTAVVTFLRLFTNDPILIYQLFCGAAFATLSSSLFLAARRIGGLVSAHIAAGLVIICPALTTYLINHHHSYSHIGAVLAVGPAILVSISLLLPNPNASPGKWRYLVCGILWGLVYLCRTETLLFAGLLFCVLACLHFLQKKPYATLVFYTIGVATIFLPYNVYADYVAKRDDLWMRKSIYGFYISQGWAEPEKMSGGDIEAQGYILATKIYGDPKSNNESLLRAINRHPSALFRRMKQNARNFYAHYRDAAFVPAWWSCMALISLLLLPSLIVPKDRRLPLLFCLGAFLASNVILIYHIDARYLTINIPFLILLAAYGCHLLWIQVAGRSRAAAIVCVSLVVFFFGYSIDWSRAFPNGTRRPPGVETMRVAAEYYKKGTLNDTKITNLEPHVGLFFPSQNPLPDEDQYLLSYFTNTALIQGGEKGEFPRGKFYSFKDCVRDYSFIPAERYNPAQPGLRLLQECDLPGLGHYYLCKELNGQ